MIQAKQRFDAKLDAAKGRNATAPMLHVARAPTFVQDMVIVPAGDFGPSDDMAPDPPAPVTLHG
jgi:hypothetical protein